MQECLQKTTRLIHQSLLSILYAVKVVPPTVHVPQPPIHVPHLRRPLLPHPNPAQPEPRVGSRGCPMFLLGWLREER